MKNCLLVLFLIAAASSTAFAQTYTAPNRPQQKQPTERKAPPLTPRDVDGVIPRGVRGGNFLQMFNPKAPARYGTSQEAICYDPSQMNINTRHDESGKWKGIKLFAFRF